MAKQRRRRRRGPAELPGERKARPPFPVNLIFNVKAFYLFFIVVMIASMAAVGFGAGTSSSGDPAPIVEDRGTPAPTPDVQQWPDGAAPVLDARQPHVLTMQTDQGEIVVELSTQAPEAVNSLAFLAAKNFYEGAAFFYVDKDYFAQAGDPTCTVDSERACSGLGGPGYSLPYEDSSLSHEQWAMTLPAVGEGISDVHGSQFRILYSPDERLDGEETVVGMVVEGQEILEGLGDFSICSVSTASDCQEDLSNALIIEDLRVDPA